MDGRTDGQHATAKSKEPQPETEQELESQVPVSLHVDGCGRAKMYSFWDVFNFSLKSLSVVVFCACLSLSPSLSRCLLYVPPFVSLQWSWELGAESWSAPLPFASCVPPRCLSNGVLQITGNDNGKGSTKGKGNGNGNSSSNLPRLAPSQQLLSINTHLHVLGAME